MTVIPESEPGCSKKKILRSNRKSSNTESDGITEEDELNSKIHSDPSVLDRISKQSVKRRMNETNKEVIISDLDEIKTDTNENVTQEFDKENHDPEVNQDEMKENLEKRIKTENNKKMSELKSQDKKTSITIERCEYCKQKLNNDIKLYQGHPNGAIEEQIALIDPRLCLFIGDESFIDESDERPQNKLTHFRSIFMFFIYSFFKQY